LVSDEYDFPAREEHNAQGRWVSPDPMSGTGNKYVYADNNPLIEVDLYGLSGDVIVNGLGPGGTDSNPFAAEQLASESHPLVSWQTDGQTGLAGDPQRKPDVTVTAPMPPPVETVPSDLWEKVLAKILSAGGKIAGATVSAARRASVYLIIGTYFVSPPNSWPKGCYDSTDQPGCNVRAASDAKNKVPKPGISGKEGSKDVPSWAKGARPKVGDSGKDFAERLLDDKYGKGNYPKGAGSEFSKIQKWGDRAFQDPPSN
jgi:hypothetical protein